MKLLHNVHRGLACALAVAAIAAASFSACPATACALTVDRATARPNAGDDTSDVLGGTQTRITWEAYVDEGEGVEQLSLTFPEGTSFSTEDFKATLLTGDNYMTRVSVDDGMEVSADGQTLTVAFGDPIEQAGKLSLQVHGVYFPSSGGEMQLEGTYVTEGGSTHDMEGIPSIQVTGISFAESLSQQLEEQEWVQVWNSNKFLRLFLNPLILVTSFPVVLQGFGMSLLVVAFAFPLALPLGLALALMRISKLRVVRAIATTYVNIVRGTPLFLQIYIAFFGLPLAGIQIPSFVLGVAVMFLNSGAYMCEIMRAGILSIDKGQFEAARSLGMTGTQTMVSVVIPQMFRRIIPNLTNEFIMLYKDTSLLAAVGVMELIMYAKTVVAATGSITPYIVAAVFYLVITLPLSRVTRYLEDRMRSGRRRSRKQAASPAGEAADRSIEG